MVVKWCDYFVGQVFIEACKMSRPFFGGTLEGCGQLGQAIWGMILYYYHTYILANLIAVYLSVFYGI